MLQNNSPPPTHSDTYKGLNLTSQGNPEVRWLYIFIENGTDSKWRLPSAMQDCQPLYSYRHTHTCLAPSPAPASRHSKDIALQPFRSGASGGYSALRGRQTLYRPLNDIVRGNTAPEGRGKVLRVKRRRGISPPYLRADLRVRS